MTAPTPAAREMIVLTALRVMREDIVCGLPAKKLPAREIAGLTDLTIPATVLALHALKTAGLVGCGMARFKGQRRFCWHLTPAGVRATNHKVKEGV